MDERNDYNSIPMQHTQTAVEWLATYLKGITSLNCDEVIEQAKQMEKEQSISILTEYHNRIFYLPLKDGEAEAIYNHIVDTNEMVNKPQVILAEQYYNETFKK